MTMRDLSPPRQARCELLNESTVFEAEIDARATERRIRLPLFPVLAGHSSRYPGKETAARREAAVKEEKKSPDTQL